MEQQKYVVYYRVSKQKKRDGEYVEAEDDYSMKDQERIVKDFIAKEGGEIIGTFCEFISGRNDQRKEALKAVEMCKENDAKLLVALFSRVMRSLPFLMMLRAEQVKFTACDFKDANEFMINILCCVYEYQAKESNAKIARSLKIAKEKRGEWRVCNLNDEGRRKAAETKLQKWNNPNYKMLKQFCESLKQQGLTLHEIAWKVRQSAFAPILPNASASSVGSLLRREIAA